MYVHHAEKKGQQASGLREAIVASYQSGRVIRPSPNSFEIHSTVSGVVYKWRPFNTGASIPRSGHSRKFSLKFDAQRYKEKPKSYIM